MIRLKPSWQLGRNNKGMSDANEAIFRSFSIRENLSHRLCCGPHMVDITLPIGRFPPFPARNDFDRVRERQLTNTAS
jgi:hypothetical protein